MDACPFPTFVPRTAESLLQRRPRVEPHLALFRPAPPGNGAPSALPDAFTIATYNVHRWAGVRGGNAWTPDRAIEVIAGLDADVIALQEVLLPDREDREPLLDLAGRLGYHVAFAFSRAHRRGALGNAILSRWALASTLVVNLSVGRLEQRAALAVQIGKTDGDAGLSVVATHLALVDRTRKRQVASLLENPDLQGPTVLLGDMNAWRDCRASRELDREFIDAHDNRDWPPSFPAMRPVLALDRIYARGVAVRDVRVADGPLARSASDHLPVLARVERT